MGKRELLRSVLRRDSDWFDFYANIALFFPYGFGLGKLLQASKLTHWQRVLGVVVLSFSLTAMVELLQLFLPERNSSATDLFTNTLGGTLSGLYVLYHWEDNARSLLQMLHRLWSKRWLVGGLLVLWIGLVVTVCGHLQQQIDLTDWNPEFRLTIGNEYSGNRDWKGEVSGFSLSDRALDTTQVAAQFANPQFPSLPQAQLDYDLRQTLKPSIDRVTGQLPLVSRQIPPEGIWIEPEDARRYQNRLRHPWLSQDEPARDAINAIRQSHQVTIATRSQPNRLDQGGPAVIATMSLDIYQCNFSLAQMDDRLLVMVRTPVTGYNGDHFILMGSQALEKRPYRVIITYRDGVLRLYTDGQAEPDELILKPEFTFFQYVLPDGGHNLGLAEVNHRRFQSKLYPIAFYAIWSLPLGILMLRVFTLALTPKVAQSIPWRGGLLLLTGLPTLLFSLSLMTIASPWSLSKWLICWSFALVPILWNFLALPAVWRSKRT